MAVVSGLRHHHARQRQSDYRKEYHAYDELRNREPAPEGEPWRHGFLQQHGSSVLNASIVFRR
jgi:hypothetical protein